MTKLLTYARGLGKLYVKGWVLLLSHTVCICIGAAWMYLAIEAALHANGVLK